jgi:hypothetical protein
LFTDGWQQHHNIIRPPKKSFGPMLHIFLPYKQYASQLGQHKK